MKTSDVPADPPPRTAWWRVGWLVFAMTILCVALACLLGARSENEGQVAASFLGYDLIDEGSERLALIRLTNSSARSIYYFTAGAIASNGAPVVMCMYREDSGGVWNEWSEGVSPPRMTSYSLTPGGSDVVAAKISVKDKASQIGIHCLEQRANWPEPLQAVRRLWWKVLPPKGASRRAWASVAVPLPVDDPPAVSK